MHTIQIYTDGSCLGNPGFGGYGAMILDSGKEIILSGGERQTTNNRMELRAIMESLRWVAEHCTGAQVQIFSDSNLCIQSITQGWKRKKNVDLWEEFDELLFAAKAKKNILEWNWVKGHANNVYNKKVDIVAVRAAQKMKQSF